VTNKRGKVSNYQLGTRFKVNELGEMSSIGNVYAPKEDFSG
jgi:hypothetical protein